MLEDIVNQIHKDFPKDEINEVIKIVEEFCESRQNVARCLVYLSEGNLKKLKWEIHCMKGYSPYDLLYAGEEKAGNPGHFFNLPFPELDSFLEKIYGDIEDNPPNEFYRDLEKEMEQINKEQELPTEYYEELNKKVERLEDTRSR